MICTMFFFFFFLFFSSGCHHVKNHLSSETPLELYAFVVQTLWENKVYFLHKFRFISVVKKAEVSFELTEKKINLCSSCEVLLHKILQREALKGKAWKYLFLVSTGQIQ